MPSAQHIDDVFNRFLGDIYSYVKKGHILPLGPLLGKAPGLRYIDHGARMAKERVGEFFLHNKRKALGPLSGAAAGVGAAKGAAAIGAATGVAALAGPPGWAAIGIALGAGVVAAIIGMGASQAYRSYRYAKLRKEVNSQPFDIARVDIEKLSQVLSGGELSEMARSFEKACEARDEFIRYKRSHPTVMSDGSCREVAEYTAKILYWFKRNQRLLNHDDTASAVGPLSESGDQRLRNVLMFVEFVPRLLYHRAEEALETFGKSAVTYFDRVRTSGPGAVRFRRGFPIEDQGLLLWDEWSRNADQLWANAASDERREGPPDPTRLRDLRRVMGHWIARGAARGDPGGLVRRWDETLNALQVVVPAEPTEIGSMLSRGAKGVARAQKTPDSLGVSVVLKPTTALATKQIASFAVSHASLSNAGAWAHGATGGAIGLLPAVAVGAFTSAISEAINSKLNLKDIFNPSFDPAKKVWLIRSVLEFGGVAEVMNLRNKIDQSIGYLRGFNSLIAVRKNARKESEDYLAGMVEELYRLHHFLVRLAVQMVLWEILVETVGTRGDDLVSDLREEFLRFEGTMKSRLKDAFFHNHCNSICYYDTNDTGQPDNPMPPA